MKASEVKIGQLILVKGFGLCVVMKFFAPAYIGVVVVDPSWPSIMGEWRYLRGLDFDEAEILADGN